MHCVAVFTQLSTFLLQGEFKTAAAFAHFYDPKFILGFAASSGMGLLLTYSSVLSTTFNSPLATSVTGNIKVGFTSQEHA